MAAKTTSSSSSTPSSHSTKRGTVMLLVALLVFHTIAYSRLLTRHVSTTTRDSAAAVTSHPLADLPVPGSIGNPSGSGSKTMKSFLDDERNVLIPKHEDGTPMTLEERLRYLELKLNSHLNFGTDPFLATKANERACKKSSELGEFGCVKGFEGYDGTDCAGSYDHALCLDALPPPRPDPFAALSDRDIRRPPCLVYDFGVRDQPEFGAVMARVFGCEVHAFDPSPVSVKWWKSKSSDSLKALGNYHFHPYGAGGIDGDLTLHEYNWGQISILKYPSYYLDCNQLSEDGKRCKEIETVQTPVKVPIKTLPTIRKELGHLDRHIDVMKLDVEGSEYAFVEQFLDASGGCPDYIGQLALEWHHMSWDNRYGEGSSPELNTITTLLQACDFELFWHYNTWPAHDLIYRQMGLDNIRYSLSSYMRKTTLPTPKATTNSRTKKVRKRQTKI